MLGREPKKIFLI